MISPLRQLAHLALGGLALLGALATPGCSQAADPGGDGPALWRMSDANSEIWLLGTAHMLPKDLKWDRRRIDAAMTAANTVMFETPIDAAGTQAIGEMVVQYGRNPPGVTLSSLLTPGDRDALAKVCKMINVDPAALEAQRPWLAGVGLSVAYVVSKGLDPQSGVEHQLDAQAQATGKKREYFETSEQQIRFFADLPVKTQVDFLHSTLHEIQAEEEDFNKINTAWATGDTKTMGAYFADMDKETSPEVYNVLIRDRNARWVTKIEEMMAGSGKIFIAVGAAHLIGPGSVVDQLRKRGYKVEGP
jgi:uncharacterized protein YbaP (TraB family)